MYLSVDQPSRSLRDAPDGTGSMLLVGGNGHKVGAKVDTPPGSRSCGTGPSSTGAEPTLDDDTVRELVDVLPRQQREHDDGRYRAALGARRLVVRLDPAGGPYGALR